MSTTQGLKDFIATQGETISKADLLAHLDSLNAKAAEAILTAKPDGVSDFQAGQRDFSSKQGAATTQIKADFESAEKRYTNGIVAPNNPTSHTGPLSGEQVNIPDVDTGYPRSVYPTGWDGMYPSAVAEYDRGAAGLPDVNEYRMKFGVVIPSTNTTVEYDFWNIILSNQLKGVGVHMSGILIDSPKLTTDEDMLEFLAQFRRQIFVTIDRLMTAEPQYIVMGMSLETFFGGWEGNKECKAALASTSPLALRPADLRSRNSKPRKSASSHHTPTLVTKTSSNSSKRSVAKCFASQASNVVRPLTSLMYPRNGVKRCFERTWLRSKDARQSCNVAPICRW